MPPRMKVTKTEIIDSALTLVRKGGMEGLNARNIAAALGCSTQPIFSNFTSMEELYGAVLKGAYDLYFAYLQREEGSGKYPQYKSFGMGYIRFAKEERELFKLLFMQDRKGKSMPTGDFDASVDMIMGANGISKEKATLIHLEMWTCVHGIASMIATSFWDLEESLISEMITDVYQGIRARHLGDKA